MCKHKPLEAMKNIESIQLIRNNIDSQKAKIISQFPNWDPIKDARITIFSKCINVCNSTQLAFTFMQFHLTDIEWWQKISKNPISHADIQIYINEYDMFTKIGFLQFSFSSIESALRIFVKSLDPTACNNGTSEFKNIYSYLLKRLNLQSQENMLDLLRLIRNTIHNNGVYFHKNGNNESISYKGKSYDFNIGNRISFVTWDFIFEIMKDIEDLIVEIINSNELRVISMINDPYAQ